MPISQTQIDTLKTAVDAMSDYVNALDADPEVNPLQEQLDAANATIATLTAKVESARAYIDSADAADATDDAARAAIKAELS